VSISGLSRGVLTLWVYCARQVTLYQAMSGVQIGVDRLYGERSSHGEPGMGNYNTFLKTQAVVKDWCNSSTNILN